jgi:hypothetical protein
VLPLTLELHVPREPFDTEHCCGAHPLWTLTGQGEETEKEGEEGEGEAEEEEAQEGEEREVGEEL